MRSGDNNFNYFPENKLTKLANCAVYTYAYVLSRGLGGPCPPLPWLCHLGHLTCFSHTGFGPSPHAPSSGSFLNFEATMIMLLLVF